jgi:uncharacterized protein DUF3291
MTSERFRLAQANVARMRAPLDDPLMEGFRSQLEAINRIADESPGFVWRLQTAEGDATSIRAFDDERVLFNMSVWDSIEALHAYVYRSGHVEPLRSRREWFEPLEGPSLVLWWIPEGHVPTVEEAKAKLRLLQEKGPGPEAFTFRSPFPAPGTHAGPAPEVDAEFCGGMA